MYMKRKLPGEGGDRGGLSNVQYANMYLSQSLYGSTLLSPPKPILELTSGIYYLLLSFIYTT